MGLQVLTPAACAELGARHVFHQAPLSLAERQVERLNRTLQSEWAYRQIFSTNPSWLKLVRTVQRLILARAASQGCAGRGSAAVSAGADLDGAVAACRVDEFLDAPTCLALNPVLFRQDAALAASGSIV
jgi:hypothetical protein